MVACASEMLPLNCDPRVGEMSTSSDRTDKARFAEASILFLVSIALFAAVNIVLFSVASISLLGSNKETLTQSRSHNSHLEDKVISVVVSHMDSAASPVPARTNIPLQARQVHEMFWTCGSPQGSIAQSIRGGINSWAARVCGAVWDRGAVYRLSLIHI